MAFTRCSVPPQDDRDPAEIKMITRLPQKDPTSMQALIQGKLWVHENCVKIGETSDQSQTVVWRAGFRVGKDDKGLFIHHPDHQQKHRIGEKVRFGGGYLDDFDVSLIEGGDVRGCSGPFIFVDDVSVPKKSFWR